MRHHVVTRSSSVVTMHSSFRRHAFIHRLFSILIYTFAVLLLTACEDEPVSTGIDVNAGSSLVTTEAGASTNFSLVLKSQPTQDVVIAIRSSNASEGLVSNDNISFSPATEVQFTPANWSVPQMVYIQGVNDNINDGNVDYKIITEPASSGDGGYQSLNASDVSVTNFSITFDPGQVSNAALIINPVTPLLTSEDGSKETQIQISLDSQPTANVIVSVGSLDSTEGTTQPNQPELLIFTSLNWDQVQTISLFGVDDLEVDGDVEYQILIGVQSTDLDFKNVANTLITLLNLDDETTSPVFAAAIVTPITGLVTSEDQGAANSATFTLSLNTSPAVGESITINALVSNIDESTVQPGSVLFTSDNWQTAVEFSLAGVDDTIVDGNQPYTVSFTSVSSIGASSPYHGISIADVQAINIDNEIAAATLSVPPAGLLTSEDGSNASFTVVLDAAPVADVTISAISSDSSEAVVSSASLTFSPSALANIWNQPQTITVTGVDDDVIDGSQSYSISLSSSSLDANFDNMTIATVPAVNADNDVADIAVILPTGGTISTSENLSSKTFSMVLNAAPVADVIITATSSDLAEATVSPASLTFSASGASAWNISQSFTVTGVDDDVSDGVQAYTIGLNASSTDVNYDSIVINAISGVNEDNDVATVSVTLPGGGIVTDENASSANFSVVLESMPSDDVTVFANSLDSSEGVVTPASITFSPNSGNLWNQAKSFSVVGQADNEKDGDKQYTIQLYTSSNDNDYSGIAIANITATNLDVDESDDD